MDTGSHTTGKGSGDRFAAATARMWKLRAWRQWKGLRYRWKLDYNSDQRVMKLNGASTYSAEAVSSRKLFTVSGAL